jgi:hypothetical protein
MAFRAFVGAVFGAALGAALWAGISALTGYEIGYVAWAVGLFVGVGASALGGHGQTTGAACAVLTLAAIFAGKVLAVHCVAPGELRTAVAEALTREAYDHQMNAARDFSRLNTDAQYRQFMVKHGFSEAPSPAAVTTEELAGFKEQAVPVLRRFHTEKLTFRQWQDHWSQVFTEQLPIVDMVLDNLGPIDLLFAFLGVATAFRIGTGTRREEEACAA